MLYVLYMYYYNEVSQGKENVIKITKKRKHIYSIYWGKNPDLSGPKQFKGQLYNATSWHLF